MVGFGQSRQRAERLMTLSWILQSHRPIPLAELRERYGLYAEGDEDSARRKFERDKHDLRELGLVIETVTTDDTSGYRITSSSSATTRVTWSDEELDTLAVLAAAVGDAATGTALARLAAPSGEFPAERSGAQVLLDVEVPDAVAEAVSSGRRLSFRYRNAEGVERDRTIEPWQLRARSGQRYVTGYDLDAGDERNFRLDRIVGAPTVGEPATHDRPDEPLGPLYPDEHIEVVASVPVDRARDVEIAGGEVLAEDDDHLRVRLPDHRSEAALAWSLRHGARILEPAELAAEARHRLQHLVEVHTGAPDPVERPRTARARPSTLTSERLRRMLTLPAWLGERAGVTLQEAATAFGCTVAEIEEELELLELIDIPGIGSVVEAEQHDDGQIVYRRFVQEPTVDLSPRDALRLLLLVDVGTTVLTPAEAPALSSISERLRAIVPASVQVELHGGRHPDLDLLKQARDTGQAVTFDYRGRKDATWRRRTVAPERIVVANGAVYLIGVDVDADDERNFRLDRLSDVELAGQRPAMAAQTVPPTYVPTDEEIEVLLRLTTRATWILSHVTPTATSPTDDAGAIAVVPTDAVAWLLAHVMAAGGEAEVVTPASLRREVAEQAARLLEAYDG